MNLVNKLSVASAGIAICLSIAAVKPAQAVALVSTTAINFDNLAGNKVKITDGYGGLKWDNFYTLNTTAYKHASGYKNGTVSQGNVAYNAWGKPASILGVNGNKFKFNSVYLTAAWRNDLSILVEGFTGGKLSYSRTVTVNSTSPTEFVFNYLGIDQVKFTSFGGVEVPDYKGKGEHFVVDNLSISQPVPEPLTIGGTAVALGFGYWMKRKTVSVSGKG